MLLHVSESPTQASRFSNTQKANTPRFPHKDYPLYFPAGSTSSRLQPRNRQSSAKMNRREDEAIELEAPISSLATPRWQAGAANHACMQWPIQSSLAGECGERCHCWRWRVTKMGVIRFTATIRAGSVYFCLTCATVTALNITD